MRILLPVDGSSYSRYAAEFIASRTSMIGKKPAVEAFYVAAPRGRVVTEIWNMTAGSRQVPKRRL